MTQQPTHDEQGKLEAMTWLTGRLRWEQLLGELHTKAEVTGAPVDLAAAVAPDAPAPARAA